MPFTHCEVFFFNGKIRLTQYVPKTDFPRISLWTNIGIMGQAIIIFSVWRRYWPFTKNKVFLFTCEIRLAHSVPKIQIPRLFSALRFDGILKMGWSWDKRWFLLVKFIFCTETDPIDRMLSNEFETVPRSSQVSVNRYPGRRISNATREWWKAHH